MAKSFVITTTATEPLRADASGHTKAVFTVTNTTARVVRGLAKVKPLGDTKREWLSLEGEPERDFPARGTHQYTVNFNGPATAPAGSTPPTAAQDGATPPAKYAFRLDIESAQDPDEDYAESPTVTVELMPLAARSEKKFPWWILIVLGALLFIGLLVLILALVLGGGNNNDNADESPTPVVSPTPSPSPSPSPSPTPTENPETACYNLVQGQIAWDYDGSKSWFPDNARKLCAGTITPKEPGQCFTTLLFGGVEWGGGTRWYPPNALELCAGTNNANSRVTCFRQKIAAGDGWQAAIAACKTGL
jgi:hypothetical protein